MTQREFYTAISNGEMNDELKDFAKEGIAKLDARNAKRASTPSKTAVANEPIKASILEFLADREAHLAKEVGEALGITTSKASALCGQLVKEEKVTASEVKVAKVGKRVAYTLAQRIKGTQVPFSFGKICLLINKRARPAHFHTLNC